MAEVHHLAYRVRPPEAAPLHEESAKVIPFHKGGADTPATHLGNLGVGAAAPKALEAGESNDGEFDDAG